MNEYQNILKNELLDAEYRYAYSEDFLNTLVATQIKVLREQRDMTQEELANLIGTKQAGVSRLENVNYCAWKTETLRKIARALGVRLRITFEDFTSLLDDTNDFGRENLKRVKFEDDPTFQNLELAATREEKLTQGFAEIQTKIQKAWNEERETKSASPIQFELALTGGNVIPFRVPQKANGRESVNLGGSIYAALGGNYGQSFAVR